METGLPTNHQRVVGSLVFQLGPQAERADGEAFRVPFDILLPDGEEPDDDVRTVVQPDVLIYLDASTVHEHGGRGAPDFIAEVPSPHTSQRDREEKLALYERHGVREYWIVDPMKKTVEARLLGADGRWGSPLAYGAVGKAPLRAIAGLVVDLAELFERV